MRQAALLQGCYADRLLAGYIAPAALSASWHQLAHSPTHSTPFWLPHCRWATKQRSAWRRGALEADKVSALESLGFAFDAEAAEWQRWFTHLCTFREEYGHCSPMPLAAGIDFYLINWCSVQRIARRSRVLSEKRVALLDGLGFDWTGADPLS